MVDHSDRDYTVAQSTTLWSGYAVVRLANVAQIYVLREFCTTER